MLLLSVTADSAGYYQNEGEREEGENDRLRINARSAADNKLVESPLNELRHYPEQKCHNQESPFMHDSPSRG
ncbi:hypothetical protein [Corynebacterium renale]|uniref:hypothetical protein n=1 Tax=Corynebacterium renale TaxID=1724 RepID=UPI0006548547|nr:hypothetical protein [Corynebacterium renale]